MPIKTIQPFVSNFNAFAGEGFYGNVVQGLVIKQLEDAVFIFGIAIDGTLIFRKRNYPDVSTWEDPKIIIHSNNWHKIYFVTDLGELIGTATGNKSGLMSVEDKKRLGRRFFKGYTKLVESKYWYNHYVALIFGASPASNLGSLIAIDWKGNELISVTRFFGNNDNVKLYLGSNPETNMYELWLGLIGLDGDGSEFIIQSRESIDLDSKTVETLPSYLKVISISWQKNNDFSELGELLQNENYIRMAEGRGSATLYRIDFMRNLNLVVKIVGEGNSEVVDDYSIICMHGGGNGLCITHNSGPSSIRMYRDNDYNYYVYVSGWGYAIAYFANRIPIYNAISATKVDIDIRTLEQVGI